MKLRKQDHIEIMAEFGKHVDCNLPAKEIKKQYLDWLASLNTAEYEKVCFSVGMREALYKVHGRPYRPY